MKVRQLTVHNFRGIKYLKWTLAHDFIVLVGPGDSAKTTILTALGWLLSPTYRLPVTEADFYGGEATAPIKLEATIVDLPPELTRFDAYGSMCRGWFPENLEARDDLEPPDECERALTIALSIDETMEPEWTVHKGTEEIRIRARDRALLGFLRIDDASDHHLRWGRGSALTAATASTDDIPAMLATAHSDARRAVAASPPSPLKDAATAATTRARTYGVDVAALEPGLTPQVATGAAALELHEGLVPVGARGSASRRLIAMSLQGLGSEKAIVAIDELEHALEPHRVRRLVHRLRAAVLSDEPAGPAQLLVTTHSPVVVTEARLNDLYVVRRGSTDGVVTVTSAGRALEADDDSGQGLVRACSEALLGRRVLVGEGATEVGFLRELLRHWDETEGTPTAHLGVTLADGGGDSAQRRALGFDRLGYPTALLLDSDLGSADLLNSEPNEVVLVQWAGGCALEARVARDLPDSLVPVFLELAFEVASQESVTARIANELRVHPTALADEPANWPTSSGKSLEDIRDALAEVAPRKPSKGKAWFKSIERGELLAEFVTTHMTSLEPACSLLAGIHEIRAFVYASATSSDEPMKPDANSD